MGLHQRMYDNYLLSEITNKINPTKSTQNDTNHCQPQKINKHRLYGLEKCYIEYLDLCESQNSVKV